MEVARAAAEIYERLGQLEAIASPSMLSDLRVGRLMAAPGRAARWRTWLSIWTRCRCGLSAKMREQSAAVEARLRSGEARTAKKA